MKKHVLFLCTGNSCRSQMAEGLLRHLKGDMYESFSAGTKPTQVNPFSVLVMSELGIDISEQKSQHINEFNNKNFDLVITVCDNAKESCPVFPASVRVLNWSFDDPAEATGAEDEILKEFRQIRDEIKEKVLKVL